MRVSTAASVCCLAVMLASVRGCAHHYFGEQASTTAPIRRLLAEGAPAAWNYHQNGADWPGTCNSGRQQSPIAIAMSATKKMDSMPSMEDLKLEFGVARGIKIINTGHACQVEWDSLTDSAARIPSRGMWGTDREAIVPIVPFQFHAHSAAEHVVNGLLGPIEVHLVTKVDDKAADAPAQCKDPLKPCLAVFGVVFTFNDFPMRNQNSNAVSRAFNYILDNIPQVVGKEGAISFPKKSLNLNLLLPQNSTIAWYRGSLTTPPCSESVSWHVFTTPRPMLTSRQLDTLQSAMATTIQEAECEMNGQSGLCEVQSGSRTNNRGLQRLNGRQVYSIDTANNEFSKTVKF